MSKKITSRLASAVTIIFTVFCLCAMLCAFFTNRGMSFFGFKSFIVLTGSMSPAFKAGSYIVVKEKNPEDIQTGDIITYKVTADVVLTHRVVEIIQKPDGSYSFITKGDANNTPDKNPVSEKQILGSVVFKANGFGKLLIALKQPQTLIYIGIFLFMAASVEKLHERLLNQDVKKR